MEVVKQRSPNVAYWRNAPGRVSGIQVMRGQRLRGKDWWRRAVSSIEREISKPSARYERRSPWLPSSSPRPPHPESSGALDGDSFSIPRGGCARVLQNPAS
jgi:hypothetical protein